VTNGGRLGGWIALVGVLSTLGYVSKFAGSEPPDDVFYRWDTAVGTLVQYGVVLAVVLLLARGATHLLALHEPRWRDAARWLLLPIGLTYLVGALLSPFLNPGKEQGLTPDSFDSARANAFFANVAVVVIVAPIVEELAFRGLGYSLLRPLGKWPAILGVGLAFGLWHGLLEALPVLFAFGAALAWLREQTGSIYPCILVHGAFNAIAVVVSITT
jgi:membrane protease YdiL (CAAX protease family)